MPVASDPTKPTYTPIKAARGNQLSCKGWAQEAALRMLQNNLDPDVAERPQDLVVYGGTGRAARNWDCYHAIVRSLQALENDETLLVQSGKPVGCLPHPRLRPARPHLQLQPRRPLVQLGAIQRNSRSAGLMMYGQMTAGSWIYIGSQGIIQGTYETFSAAADKHLGGDLAGKLIVSGGMGGMGGAQPLAATMTGACYLGIEVDPERIKKRLRTGYCDFMVNSLDEALRILKNAVRKKENISVGLVGNCGDIIPELAERGVVPDILTDQTSAHDPLNGYVPAGMTLEAANELRKSDPKAYVEKSLDTMARHVEGMLKLQKMGSVTFDYGNNIRKFAFEHGVKDAFDFPGFVPAYIRPLFCEGRGPFRWAALSGDPADIHATDDLVLQMFPQDRVLSRWIDLARKRIKFQGFPCAHLLARLRRARRVRPRHQRPGQARQAQVAHRHRPRPSRLRLRRLALPRNRVDERRQRRHRRLAAPQRAAQHRQRRLLGLHPQRRRRRHRLLPARRTSHRRRRHRRNGEAHRARPHQRPRHRRRPPR